MRLSIAGTGAGEYIVFVDSEGLRGELGAVGELSPALETLNGVGRARFS